MAKAVAEKVQKRRRGGALVWLGVLALIYVLLVGVATIGGASKSLSGGADGAAKIFAFTSNPLAGVILGILATSIVQSSSTVTSVIVGLVAGGMPVSFAVPMVMGANMGTTITNTIVSLGNIRDDSSFDKSFQAATVHDFFNLYSILIFLPIEMLFHPLERLGGVLAQFFVGGGSASMKGFDIVGASTKPVGKFIVHTFEALPKPVGGIIAIAIGIGLIIFAVVYLGKLLRHSMTGKAKSILHASFGRGPMSGIASGTVVTVLVQSSSTSTSLVVPLAGAGVLTTRQVFPFTMGANIGTTITALLAATALSGPSQVVGLQIALVHLLYNVLGVVLFSLIPWLRQTPIWSAEWLGHRAAKSRMWAVGYIFCIFFLLPGAVLGVQSGMGGPSAVDPAQVEIPKELKAGSAGDEGSGQEEEEDIGLAIE